jgi:acetyl-CoA synthetase
MTIDEQVQTLLTRFGGPEAAPGALLCDDHPPDATAFAFVDAGLGVTTMTYAELRDRSERFAAALVELGVEPGDRVATLMGKSRELVTAIVGTLRCGAVYVPLFTAFGPGAAATRLLGGQVKVVVVDPEQRAKLAPSEDIPTDPPWTVIVNGASSLAGDLSLDDLLDRPAQGLPARSVGADGPMLLLFTSGTTGPPKGVELPARALAGFVGYLDFGIGLRDDDVYWNAADPGWAYGLYYAILAPLAAGRPSILLSAGFSADLTWAVLDRLAVTNFAAAPTVYRALRNTPSNAPAGSRLRRLSSAGEPLPPDVVDWARQAVGAPIRDHYGQTELGMVIGNAWHRDLCEEIRPGSMGRTLPGWTATVLRDDAGEAPAGETGRLAVAAGSPFIPFTGYLGAPEKTAERFTPDGDWYLTGDVARREADGAFFFSSRDDDVILMAGYRIGPFDVESALLAHEAVAEAAVVGVPDPLRGEVLEAFVVLQAGAEGGDALVADLQEHVKTRYAAHAYPRQVHFVDALPRTPSGKVKRYVLRERRAAEAAPGRSPSPA